MTPDDPRRSRPAIRLIPISSVRIDTCVLTLPHGRSTDHAGHAERLQAIMDRVDAENGWLARRVIVEDGKTTCGYELVGTPIRLEPEPAMRGTSPRRYTTIDRDGNRVPMDQRMAMHVDEGWCMRADANTSDVERAARKEAQRLKKAERQRMMRRFKNGS